MALNVYRFVPNNPSGVVVVQLGRRDIGNVGVESAFIEGRMHDLRVISAVPETYLQAVPHNSVSRLVSLAPLPFEFYTTQRRLRDVSCVTVEDALAACAVSTGGLRVAFVHTTPQIEVQRFIDHPKPCDVVFDNYKGFLLDFSKAQRITSYICREKYGMFLITRCPYYVHVEVDIHYFSYTPIFVSEVNEWMSEREDEKARARVLFHDRRLWGVMGVRKLVWSFLKPKPLV